MRDVMPQACSTTSDWEEKKKVSSYNEILDTSWTKCAVINHHEEAIFNIIKMYY